MIIIFSHWDYAHIVLKILIYFHIENQKVIMEDYFRLYF